MVSRHRCANCGARRLTFGGLMRHVAREHPVPLRHELWPRACTCPAGRELGLEHCRGLASCLYVPTPVRPTEGVPTR